MVEVIENPYLDVVLEIRRNKLDEGYPIFNTNSIPPDNRWEVCGKYAWAIPNTGAIELIASLNMPVIEIGAGTGYWASLLSAVGVDIIAFDIKPYNNHWCTAQWHDVSEGGWEKAADYPERALMLCWPPYSDRMASEALSVYTGDTLIFIGEDEGGCTGDDDFFKMLESSWTLQKHYRLPQWDGIHDQLYLYKRKNNL